MGAPRAVREGRPRRPPPTRPPHGRPRGGRGGGEGKAAFIIGAILFPLLLAVATFFGAYYMGPMQESRNEQAKDQRLAEEPPLRVSLAESWNDDVDVLWRYDRPLPAAELSELDRLRPSVALLDRFARTHGGMRSGSICLTDSCDTSQTRFKMTLVGRRHIPLQIIQISARVLARREPVSGTLVVGPSGGSEDVEAGTITLDSDDLRLYAVDQGGRATRPYFDRKFVSLEQDEPIVFEVLATSSSSDIDWELVIETVAGTARETVVVRSDGTPRGRPFRNPGKVLSSSAYGARVECTVGALSCDLH
ncbi:hypothetical protein SAMN04489712_13837 [Thermomonospora echinospora]|uniref:Uncharacterized protein n=1 Tax=Thermomonospora echinospora TaxID=1992 RepID=A0A1H6E6N0_9ACTN|nr:hypothetical protein [Thermomonospora echinospora]SEG93380.1 hypothetical protein SAMN04489712_13837 [Thermomonospora echinospora]